MKKAHRYDELLAPIVQALAPYHPGRLLCGHRACPSRTLYRWHYSSMGKRAASMGKLTRNGNHGK